MFSESDTLRFWAKVDKTATCWQWTSSLDHAGYGQFSHGGRSGTVLKAHRVAWELANGPIPDGMLVCHHCDNPGCVKLAHLFMGTYQDNMDDMYRKGRDGTRAKPRKPRKISDEQVLLILDDTRLQREIAAEYGISIALVSRIKSGGRRQYISARRSKQ